MKGQVYRSSTYFAKSAKFQKIEIQAIANCHACVSYRSSFENRASSLKVHSLML